MATQGLSVLIHTYSIVLAILWIGFLPLLMFSPVLDHLFEIFAVFSWSTSDRNLYYMMPGSFPSLVISIMSPYHSFSNAPILCPHQTSQLIPYMNESMISAVYCNCHELIHWLLLWLSYRRGWPSPCHTVFLLHFCEMRDKHA